MKIEKTQIYGLESSIRAMRNPMNSWGKSDSYIDDDVSYQAIVSDTFNNVELFILGENDKTLSQKLTKAGTEHCKHLRLIQVWTDLTLPRYMWQEFDTYRFVEKVSCSTMHRITSRPLTQDDFEYSVQDYVLNDLNYLIKKYNENKQDKNLFYDLKNMLPEGLLQKRTINTNYQQLLNIYNQRKNHKLPQWQKICNWILELPYFKELTGLEVV